MVSRAQTVPGSSLAAWWLAARPPTWSAAIVPVLVGTSVAYAAGRFDPWPALAALVGALLIQIGTNFANDVFDYEKGADREGRLGPTRAVAAGLISPSAMRTGMVVAFAAAVAIGGYLAWHAGPTIVVIGVASIVSGIAYTGGPYPLGYNGLGDVFVMVFFGFVAVCGTTFVQAGYVPWLAVWASVPVGSLATAILVINNVRDRETDVHAGKRTLAVRFGRKAAFGEFVLLLVASYAVPVLLVATSRASFLVLLPLVTLPLAYRLSRDVHRGEGRALNRSLRACARLLLLFGVSFAVGLGFGDGMP